MWAAATFLIVLGPYLFGAAPARVAKQIVLNYVASCAIFGYALYKTTLFNTIVMGPMTGEPPHAPRSFSDLLPASLAFSDLPRPSMNISGLCVVFAAWGAWVLKQPSPSGGEYYMA